MRAAVANRQLVYRSEEACAYGHAIVTVWRVDGGYVGEVFGHGYGPWSETSWAAGNAAWQCWDELLLASA